MISVMSDLCDDVSATSDVRSDLSDDVSVMMYLLLEM